MDVRDCQVFLKLAETRHFGRTAAQCSLSPSAVSRQLKRIEAEVGQHLLDRDSRQVHLTPAGRHFLEYARKAVADWQQVIALLSVLSMFLGAIAAIGQTNIKRLMAYSSIAHMGYALMGLAAGTAAGVEAMLVYVAIYVTMNIGTFAFILSMERDGEPVLTISALSLFSRRDSARAIAMLILLFSLAGVPPFLGFFGKYAVLLAAVDAGLTWLAVLGVIASVIGAFYYLRIVYLMYFGEETDPLDKSASPILWGVLMVSAAIMVFGIVNLFGIEAAASAASLALVN